MNTEELNIVINFLVEADKSKSAPTNSLRLFKQQNPNLSKLAYKYVKYGLQNRCRRLTLDNLNTLVDYLKNNQGNPKLISDKFGIII